MIPRRRDRFFLSLRQLEQRLASESHGTKKTRLTEDVSLGCGQLSARDGVKAPSTCGLTHVSNGLLADVDALSKHASHDVSALSGPGLQDTDPTCECGTSSGGFDEKAHVGLPTPHVGCARSELLFHIPTEPSVDTVAAGQQDDHATLRAHEAGMTHTSSALAGFELGPVKAHAIPADRGGCALAATTHFPSVNEITTILRVEPELAGRAGMRTRIQQSDVSINTVEYSVMDGIVHGNAGGIDDFLCQGNVGGLGRSKIGNGHGDGDGDIDINETGRVRECATLCEDEEELYDSVFSSYDDESGSVLVLSAHWNPWEARNIGSSDSEPPAEFLSTPIVSKTLGMAERITIDPSLSSSSSKCLSKNIGELELGNINDDLAQLGSLLGLGEHIGAMPSQAYCAQELTQTGDGKASVSHAHPDSLFYKNVAKVGEDDGSRFSKAMDSWLQELSVSQADPFCHALLLLAKASLRMEKQLSNPFPIKFPGIIQDWLIAQHLVDQGKHV